MWKYAGIIKNDMTAAPGVSVTFFTQGCPHHCKGCHNPETWSFKGGKTFTDETLKEIIDSLKANGIRRKLCIMGGEPLCNENSSLTLYVIKKVKEVIPDIEVYIWTGYLYENLKINGNEAVQNCLKNIDVLIDGPFIENLRDITLKMRGSSNQRILYKGKDF